MENDDDSTRKGGARPFDHERLDVYQLAVECVARAERIARSVPAGRAYLADQLRRAASSVSLNIGEGAGEFAKNEKRRFYRMALRSASECAAILDVVAAVNEERRAAAAALKSCFERVAAMLTKMCR